MLQVTADILYYISLDEISWNQREMLPGSLAGVTILEPCHKVNLTQIGFKSSIFQPCDLEIWWMTLKNNRAPLLCYIKLCASFQSHRLIQTGATVRKCSIRVKMGVIFLFRATLKFDGWPWKTIGHLFYATSKLCASFPSHRWIQTGVAVQKRSNRVKISDFLSRVTLKFDGWPWKTIEHHFHVASSFVHHLSHRWIQTKVEVARFCLKILQSCTLKYDRRGLAALLLSHMSNFQAIGEF